MQGVNCAFCGDEIIFNNYQKIATITVAREEDGANVYYEYWVHENCLPEELKIYG